MIRIVRRALVDMIHSMTKPTTSPGMSRRDVLIAMSGSFLAITGCGSVSSEPPVVSDGRLFARSSTPIATPALGLTALPVSLGVVGLLFVPKSYDAAKPAPGALLLHGAGQGATELMTPLSKLADDRGLVLLAIGSTDVTWDAIGRGVFGPDVRAIDTALKWMFERCAIDPARLGVIGFSDGATYSLALGRVNGDLFRRVVAYSPGFLVDVATVGRPEIFVTHGTQDPVLSYANTRDFIVPTLVSRGYVVQFRDFTGGHGVPEALITETADWFVRKV